VAVPPLVGGGAAESDESSQATRTTTGSRAMTKAPRRFTRQIVPGDACVQCKLTVGQGPSRGPRM